MKRSTVNHKWKKMRACHLLTYPECRACGTEERVIVHHLRYRGKRGQSEQPGDLMTLCWDCHSELHRLHARGTNLIEHTLTFVEQVRAVVG